MTNGTYLENALTWLIGLKSELFRQRSLSYVLALSVSVTVLFGLVIYVIDPNVHSFWDGIWYAWVTMTHVGYGDVVPTSFIGRILASVLILFGLAVLALMTATFSSILIGRGMGEVARDESQILAELKRLHDRLDQLEASRKAGD